MTNPKTTEQRNVASRAKPASPPAKADAPAPEKQNTDRDPVLDQLVSLTRSISALVQQNVDDGAANADLTTAATAAQTRVVFAYDFLGVVLGRRAPSLFQLRTVNVVRDFGTLTFTGIGDATVAKIRAAGNRVKTVEIREGEAVTIDRDPDAINDDQRIDSIITFTSVGGVPVAIGPCQGPVFGGVG
jgi:hypothetical protein